jgi:NAD(P)-dependent dehydrogenase (short-subunit alcohol dehydrogenase family)
MNLCSVVYDPEHADERAASDAASAIREAGGGRVDLLVNAAGMLHDSSTGDMPEKALRMVRWLSVALLHGVAAHIFVIGLQVKADWLQRSFAVHTMGPLLLIQALAPLLRVKKNERSPTAVVNISARVGSIQDNNLGGWCGTGLAFHARRANCLQRSWFLGATVTVKLMWLWIGAHPGTRIVSQRLHRTRLHALPLWRWPDTAAGSWLCIRAQWTPTCPCELDCRNMQPFTP